MINNITEKKSYVATDDEKEVWVEKDSFQTNFIWVKYADEDTKREVKECRCASQLSVDGDYLYYIKDNYFFRLHLKMLVVEFIDENIYDFRIFRDITIAIKYEHQEGLTETRAIFLKISLTNLKKDFVKIDNAEEGHFLKYNINRVGNYEFNEKYLVGTLAMRCSSVGIESDLVDYLWVTELATGKTRKLAEWCVKYRRSEIPAIYGGFSKYEENVINLDDDWIYIKRIWEGTDIENFKISYDGTQKEILN